MPCLALSDRIVLPCRKLLDHRSRRPEHSALSGTTLELVVPVTAPCPELLDLVVPVTVSCPELLDLVVPVTVLVRNY